MKQFFVFLFLIAFGLASCNNDKKSSANETEDKIQKEDADNEDEGIKDENTAEKDMEKRIEALKKLQPYTLEQLKTLLPQEMNGANRKNYNAHSALGYAVVQADYAKNDSNSMQISIYDCAGEAGAGFYTMNFWSKMNFQQETDNGYTKTIGFMDGRAVESYDKNSKQATLQFVSGDRLLIMMTGTNMTADELKTAAQKMSFKI